MKIQHKRSNQLDGGSAKEPTSEFMEYGELAVNFNESDPAIFLKDSNDNIVRIAGAGANGNIEIPDAGSDPHQPGTSDDRYVEVTGDNMTGDLTLGTDQITLDATDGSAEFAGGDLVVSSDGELTLTDSGRNLQIKSPTAASKAFIGTTTNHSLLIQAGVNDVANSVIYFNTGVNGRAQINKDGDFITSGSAEFAGGITTKGDAGIEAFNQIKAVRNEGVAYLGGSSFDGLYIYDASATETKASIKWNGAIVNTVDDTSTQASVLSNRGSISGTVQGTMVYKTAGNLELRSGESDVKINLNGVDGSAKFAGDLIVGTWDPANNASRGSFLGRGGGLSLRNVVKTSSDMAIDVEGGIGTAAQESVFTVATNGIVTAANVSFNLETDNDANYTTTTEEYEEQEELTPYIPAVEAVYGEPPLITPAVDPVVGPLGNVLVEGTEAVYGEAPLISEAVPAVEATYQTVTKTREIRTYTGPTLDVKDRLQNLISRIDAIEANEVADDATDSALLQLVASLTARLDEKDAAIASLTATLTALTDRVTTLES